ncbi:MAG: anhydro-N-acetylmuramic acid kinase, partial [Pseudomonadota bacterium]
MKTALGLMSGTSMDGIDVALVRTDGEGRVERGPSASFDYSAATRRMLVNALKDARDIVVREQRPDLLRSAEDEITRLHVDAVQTFLSAHNLVPEDIDLIGFHGQSVLHRPQSAITVQIGDGQRLADETRIATVHDMRANDMIHGGQGAPLIPVYHQALATGITGRDGPVCFVNIGGISNITYVGDTCLGDELIAFDSGPGNALIDQWVQKHVGITHDQGGMIAAEGHVDEALAERYMADGFFEKKLPKSLDRNDFKLPQDAENLGVETVARTLASVTARAIFRSLDHLPEAPRLWVICGGGRHNPFIMKDLFLLAAQHETRVIAAEEAGFDGDAMEAEGWAYLAVRAELGLPLTFPGTTG